MTTVSIGAFPTDFEPFVLSCSVTNRENRVCGEIVVWTCEYVLNP